MTPRIAKLLSRHDYLETVIRSHADQIRDKVSWADDLRAGFPAVGRAFHTVAQALREEGWSLPEITEVPQDDFHQAVRTLLPDAVLIDFHQAAKWLHPNICLTRGAFRTRLDLSPPIQD